MAQPAVRAAHLVHTSQGWRTLPSLRLALLSPPHKGKGHLLLPHLPTPAGHSCATSNLNPRPNPNPSKNPLTPRRSCEGRNLVCGHTLNPSKTPSTPVVPAKAGTLTPTTQTSVTSRHYFPPATNNLAALNLNLSKDPIPRRSCEGRNLNRTTQTPVT